MFCGHTISLFFLSCVIMLTLILPFITFPIFVTINLTQPASTLSKELPPNSFFSLRNVLSMAGQLLIQFLAQLGFILYVLSLEFFKQERSESHAYYVENGDFQSGSALSLGLFVLSNNLYLGIVLSTSVSKEILSYRNKS